ncbi:MAG: nuclear transport factor 2 family protein [Defluviitaleaceae bacterium]|nr:nuclear transport factor 2 family protein [Defluviitaleaceae bacterium]
MTDFKDALDAHLKTIKERDLAGFSEFLHPDHPCIIILPNGSMISGNGDIVDFHRDWFADADWRMDVSVVDIFADDAMGYALLDVVYHDLDEGGEPYQMNYFLSLLFKNVGGKWVLVRDQNTLK